MSQDDNNIPFALVASNVAVLMEAIDAGDVSETVKALLKNMRLDTSRAIDHRIHLLSTLESCVESFKQASRQYSLRAKQVEHAIERIEEYTIQVMEQFPGVFTGSLGKLRVQNNPPKTEVKLELKQKSLRNVVDAGDIAKHAIDPKFYETHTYYTLILDEIKEAIEAGEDIKWAELTRGKGLRKK